MKKSVQKWKMRSIWIPVTLASSFAVAGLSPVKTYQQNTTDLDLTGEYFYTTSNYGNTFASSSPLASGNSVQWMAGDARLRTIMPKRNWALYAGAELANSSVRGNSGNTSITNLNYLNAGTDFIMYDDIFSLIPEATLQYPLNRIDYGSSNASTSDGAMMATAKMNAQVRILSAILGGSLGYTYRDSGRSSFFPYSIFLELDFKTWELGARLAGYSTASYDQDTNNTTTHTIWQSNAMGGSALFGSVNPQVLETDAWIQLHPNKKWTISAGGGTTLAGTNSANGWDIMGGLTYRFGSEAPRRVAPYKEFNEETNDGVDQTLFQDQPQPRRQRKPVPVQPDNDMQIYVAPQDPAPAPAPAPVTPRPTPAQDRARKNLQKTLDNTEMQMQLKKDNRPRSQDKDLE